MGPEHYFILTYRLSTGELGVEEFAADNAAAAVRYSALELQHRDDANVEVVMVGADSIETIRKTHSHYFAPAADDHALFGRFLADAPTRDAVLVSHAQHGPTLPPLHRRRR